MPTRSNTTIANQLTAAQQAIVNTLGDAQIAMAVAEYGYDTARLNVGMALYEAALTAVNAQRAARADQKVATAEMKARRKTAHDAYQAAAKLARATLPAEELTGLGLVGKQPRDTAGLIYAGYILFDNAQAGGLLADYGYDAARIAAERAKISAYDAANRAQEMAKGTAQQATEEQKAALHAMNVWVAQYRQIARIALRDKKELWGKIGAAQRTGKTGPQRPAVPPTPAPPA